MANFNYAVMLGCEPYDYVERTSDGEVVHSRYREV